MAKLPTYESTDTISVGTPARTSDGIYQGVAKGLQSVGDAVTKYQDNRESSLLAANAATAHATLTNEWEALKTNSDVTDPDVAAKFQDRVEEVVGGLGNDISSTEVRNRYETVAATLRAGFTIKTAADVATAQGEQAVANADKIKSSFSNSVALDPHSLEETIALDKFMVDGLGLPPKAAATLHQSHAGEYSKAAVLGLTENGNTAKARNIVESGRLDNYLDASEKSTLLGKISSAEKAIAEDAKALVTAARQKRVDDAKELSQSIIGRLPVDSNGHYAVYPGAMQEAQKIGDSETQRSTMDFLRSVQAAQEHQAPRTSDTAAYDMLRQRIFDPTLSRTNPVSQNELMTAFADGKLNDPDFTMLRNGLAGNDDPATKQYNQDVQSIIQGLKSSITDSSLIKVNQYGDQRYAEFGRDVDSYARVIFTKDGASPATSAKIDAYARSIVPKYQLQGGLPAAVKATTDKVNGPLPPLPPVPKSVAPRNPGESVADYLKRTGR